MATVDANEPRLEFYTDAPRWRQPDTAHPDDPMGFWNSTAREAGLQPKSDWMIVEPELTNDFRHFLDCLQADRPSDVPASLGASVLETIFRAYEAAATHEMIPIGSARAK